MQGIESGKYTLGFLSEDALKPTPSYLASSFLGVGLLAWFNVAVLCRADQKFSGGCGGLELYLPVSLMLHAPVIGALLLIGKRAGEAYWSRAWLPSVLSVLALVQLQYFNARWFYWVAYLAVIALAALMPGLVREEA